MSTLLPLVTLLVTLAPAAAPPHPDFGRVAPESMPRLRPHDARAAALLLDGIARSPRMRAIVDRLELHDVIVYLEMQPALRDRLAGTLTWMASAGRFRYVRISLNPALSTSTLIATLGHELQHALEVAEAPGVRDAASLEAHYRQNGISMRGHANGWDTEAARVAGDEVRRELGGGRRGGALASLGGFDPQTWHVTYRRARDLLPR